MPNKFMRFLMELKWGSCHCLRDYHPQNCTWLWRQTPMNDWSSPRLSEKWLQFSEAIRKMSRVLVTESHLLNSTYLYDIEAAIWKPRLSVYFGQCDGREGGEGGRFEHHGVTARQGRRRLPRRHLERVVPRPDTPDHTQWLTDRVREAVVGKLGKLAW